MYLLIITILIITLKCSPELLRQKYIYIYILVDIANTRPPSIKSMYTKKNVIHK